MKNFIVFFKKSTPFICCYVNLNNQQVVNNSVNNVNNFSKSEKPNTRKMSKNSVNTGVFGKRKKVIKNIQQLIHRFTHNKNINAKSIMAPRQILI